MPTAASRNQPITREGHARLTQELVRLRDELRDLTDELRNGESASGREQLLVDQQGIQHRIDELDTLLSQTTVVDPPDDGTAGVGHHVTLRLGDQRSEQRFQLVGPLEADTQARKLSIDSPIGSAIIGCRVGDVVTAMTPGGDREVHLLAVSAD